MSNYTLTYIIDDDPIQCFLNKKMMEDISNFGKIESYPNGKIAFDEIAKRAIQKLELPSLILLDINMPVMDGWEFLEALLDVEVNSLPPIYIVTSSVDFRDVDKAKSFGEVVSGYIVKPISAEKLKKALELD